MRAILMLIFFVGCTSPTVLDVEVRSALDVFGHVVDPSYSFAVDSCILREEEVTQRVEKGQELAVAEYKDVKKRCGVVRRAFDEIRAGHNHAVELVEQGKMEEAQEQLNEVKAWFYRLRENLPASSVEHSPTPVPSS